MKTNRTLRKIKKALRDNACVGICRQMHFGVAFYVVPFGNAYQTPIRRKPKIGDIVSTIYEEWYDMVPDESGAVEIYRQNHYGIFPWQTVLRRLKERRLAT